MSHQPGKSKGECEVEVPSHRVEYIWHQANPSINLLNINLNIYSVVGLVCPRGEEQISGPSAV